MANEITIGGSMTLRRIRFVDAYLTNGGNATQAARTAGYTGDDKTLQTQGSRLLSDDVVQMHMRARLAAESVTADRIIAEMERIAFMADEKCMVRDYDRAGALKSERLDYTAKNVALANLAKIRGLLRDKVEVEHSVVRELYYAPPATMLTATVVPEERDAEQASMPVE